MKTEKYIGNLLEIGLCPGTRSNGQVCGRNLKPGQNYCGWHDPQKKKKQLKRPKVEVIKEFPPTHDVIITKTIVTCHTCGAKPVCNIWRGFLEVLEMDPGIRSIISLETLGKILSSSPEEKKNTGCGLYSSTGREAKLKRGGR
jgi:hypothetical protein